MSLSLSLNNALSGLGATARMAEVVSSNLAGALTEGYARRGVELSSDSLDGRGAGVRVDGVSRAVDRFLLADRRDAEGAMRGREATFKGLSALEAAMGTAEAGTSLASRLTALEEALVAAGADPSSDTRLAQVLDRLGQVTAALHDASDAVTKGREDADAAIARQVDDLNAHLKGIEGLNGDIVAALGAGRDATGLMDQRQALIDKVARIVPVREMDRQGGAVALVTPQGAALLDGRAAEVGFAPVATMTPATTMASGHLSGLTLNGQAMTPAGVGRLGSGSLEASFALRDVALPQAQDELDALARSLVERFASATADPSLTPGQPGLLTDAGAALAPAATLGLSGRIAVNARVDPAQTGGELRRLRDGVGSAAPGPAGDATQIDRWLGALEKPLPLSTGGRAASAATLAADVAAGVSARRLGAEEEVSYASARWSGLHEAELADGVDSDHEMQMLLRIEQAYAANARVIQTVEAMMQSLMEI